MTDTQTPPGPAAETRDLYPVVPLREMVVFPGMMVPFVVGRKASVAAVEQSLTRDSKLFLVAQRNPDLAEPDCEDVYHVGTLVTIIQNVRLSTGNIKLLVEGQARAEAVGYHPTEWGLEAHVQLLDIPQEEDNDRHTSALRQLFKKYARLSASLPLEDLMVSFHAKPLGELCDTVAGHLPLETDEKQALLESLSALERYEKLRGFLEQQIEFLSVDEKVNDKVRHQMEKAQREYYLGEKMKAIKKELGHKGEDITEIEELRTKIEKSGMPKDAKGKALKEIGRLESMPPVSAEATVSHSYLDWLVSMPWKKRSREIKDIERAHAVLDKDHYGLEDVKERILEYLAVRQLVSRVTASILCFVGPPGVGKSSLAKSIAEATGRKFARLSLGGVRDEADIRGHRRTYIGSFPGQIVQMVKRCGTRNPVLLLDEIDKLSTSSQGNPAAALLEVLDPEHNKAFVDHYLDVEFDLSEVFFICTANVLHTIPPALQDRLEVIELSGYTLGEKRHIAEDHLIRKQLKKHGLKDKHLKFETEALLGMVEKYTRESGVRQLERSIAKTCRRVAKKVVTQGKSFSLTLDDNNLSEWMGVPLFVKETLQDKAETGVAHGLAWTSTGGDVLTVEAAGLRGRGRLRLTGKLGSVMKESASAALSCVRRAGKRFGLADEFYEKTDFHLHVPQGAIPKDGPSAGITMAVVFYSVITNTPVRRDIAMTGEITLRGHILPIGGVKEKVLAAHRFGIRQVLLPEGNRKDECDIPEEVLEEMKLHYVKTLDEALPLVLVNPPALKPVAEAVAEVPLPQ